jgi:ABC-type multidrug transport system ATPase subunit
VNETGRRQVAADRYQQFAADPHAADPPAAGIGGQPPVVGRRVAIRQEADPAREHLIETQRLTKRYGDRLAVDAVDLRVRRGQVYGFLGPNGAGKTTTLRMLLGLAHPTSGTARVLGAAPGHPAALARIGMLVEGPGFYPYLSGRDNLRVVARYAGVPAGRVDAVLDVVQLGTRGADRFGAYSMGMKQRLGVAAALLKEPELLVLDEPTNGLDPAGMADMRSLIRGLRERGHTVLLSSHLLGEVQQICDRVGVIFHGRLLREGTVEELRGGGEIVVRAEPLTTAAGIAVRLLGGTTAVTVRDNALHLDVPAERAGQINRTLVEAGVEVHELRWSEPTLEAVFLELTNDRKESPDARQPVS